jgi:diguanylate cyclase (GGDEF)-like protein
VNDPQERTVAGRLTGLLWVIGGVSGALWYLVPGVDLTHWQLGLVSCSFSVAVGVACLVAPWRRLPPGAFYAVSALALVFMPIVIAVNGGADSPTVLYLFLASVLFGYFLPTRLALTFLAIGVLVPATPMLYDPDALEATFIARCVLTAPIYAAVGLTVVLSKRQLVAWRVEALEQSLRDPLTGLANRRALTNALRDQAPPLALVMLDLDDFKLANTLFGHVGGDKVLCSVGEALRRATRSGDLVSRLGGDEFAVLVTGASEAEVRGLAARVVEEIRSVEPPPGPATYRVTASVGYALLEPGGDPDELLGAADFRLRRAKVDGKDRFHAEPARTRI